MLTRATKRGQEVVVSVVSLERIDSAFKSFFLIYGNSAKSRIVTDYDIGDY